MRISRVPSCSGSGSIFGTARTVTLLSPPCVLRSLRCGVCRVNRPRRSCCSVYRSRFATRDSGLGKETPVPTPREKGASSPRSWESARALTMPPSLVPQRTTLPLRIDGCPRQMILARKPVAEGVPPFPWSLFSSLTTPAGAKWAHDLEKLQERDFEEVLAEELEESPRETESPRFSTHIPQRRPHAGAAAQATRALGEGVQASPKGSLTSRGCTPGLQPRDLNVAINRGGPASSAGPPLGSATSP